MSTLEMLHSELSKIASALQAGQAGDSVVDKTALLSAATEQVEALRALQTEQRQKNQPQRRIPGALIGPDGHPTVAKNNRYYHYLRAFEYDGAYRFGNYKLTEADMEIGYYLAMKGHALMPDRVQAPSEDLKAAIKALTSTGSGAGDEYVPTGMADAVWEDIFMQSRVAGTISVIPQPTNPFDVPRGLGNLTWRKGTEGQKGAGSDPSTAKMTMTATELYTKQTMSYTLNEDSLIAIAPMLRAELSRSAAEVIDDFALNADATDADTGNINSDDANPVNDAYYLSEGQDGIRHQWIVDNTNQTVNAGGDALADQDIIDAMKKMDKYAADPSQLALVCDVGTYLAGFLALTNAVTVDKFGPSAVVLTGQLAAYRGVPIIVSNVHRKAEADGKRSATEASNTLGSLSIYHRGMWKMGFRRNLIIEADRDIEARLVVMVSSLRQSIAAWGTRSTNTHTAGVRNILV